MYRVVLIDDERFVLASLEGRIEWQEHGFSVVGKAMDAVEGMALIRKERPDVVFTDIKMPGMNGLEMIRELVDEFPQTKFVILSGYNEFQYAKQAMEYGVLGFCVKPFDEEEIYGILERARHQLEARQAGGGTQPMTLRLGTELSAGELDRFLGQYGFLPDSTRLIVLCGKETELPLPGRFPHIELEDPPSRRGYLVAAESMESLKPFFPAGRQIGVSRPFTRSGDFSVACKEATLAYFQKFINKKPCNAFVGSAAAEQSVSLTRELQSRYYCRDLAGAHEIFAQLESLFSSGTLTIRSAHRLYQAMLFIFADGGRDCETYEQLCERYDSVEDMLHAIEHSLIAGIAGTHAMPERRSAIDNILCYVNEHYFDYGLSMQVLSEKFDLNANYISQLFRKSPAESFTKYLTAVRMEHAKDMLEKSEDSIKSVGEKVGYADYFYFAKVFKKTVHQTPGEYRLTHTKNAAGANGAAAAEDWQEAEGPENQ